MSMTHCGSFLALAALGVLAPLPCCPAADPKPAAEPGAIEVHFTDGSHLKMKLLEDKVEIVTAAGKKTVNLADLRKIEVAHHLSDAEVGTVKNLIAGLGSNNFKDREKASTNLIRFGIKAYPALLAASKGDDAETRQRATVIIGTLKQTYPEELFVARPEDVLWTKDGKLTGKVNEASWKAETSQFGVVQLKPLDVVRVRMLAHADPEPAIAVLPDPGTLDNLARNVGQVYAFKVIGTNTGSIYGTGTYTSDSILAKAAVHAGILEVGQTGTVKVKIVNGLNAYPSTTQNGITSSQWGPWSTAYEIVK